MDRQTRQRLDSEDDSYDRKRREERDVSKKRRISEQKPVEDHNALDDPKQYRRNESRLESNGAEMTEQPRGKIDTADAMEFIGSNRVRSRDDDDDPKRDKSRRKDASSSSSRGSSHGSRSYSGSSESSR